MFNWKNQPTKWKRTKISKTSIYDWVPKAWFGTRNGAVRRMKTSIWGQPVYVRDCCYLSLYIATSSYLSDDGVSHRADTQKHLLHKSGQLPFFFLLTTSSFFFLHFLYFLHFLKIVSSFQTEPQWPFHLECIIAVVQSLSHVQLFATLWIAARQVSL